MKFLQASQFDMKEGHGAWIQDFRPYPERPNDQGSPLDACLAIGHGINVDRREMCKCHRCVFLFLASQRSRNGSPDINFSAMLQVISIFF